MKKELMRLEAEIRVVCLKTEKRATHQVVAMATRSKKAREWIIPSQPPEGTRAANTVTLAG